MTNFMFNHFSDGDDDCGDFSDETHCVSKTNCSDDSFGCNNGLCIPQEWFCGEFWFLLFIIQIEKFERNSKFLILFLQMGRTTVEIILMRQTALEREFYFIFHFNCFFGLFF